MLSSTGMGPLGLDLLTIGLLSVNGAFSEYFLTHVDYAQRCHVGQDHHHALVVR